MFQFKNALKKEGADKAPGFDCAGYTASAEFLREAPWLVIDGENVTRSSGGFSGEKVGAKTIPGASIRTSAKPTEWAGEPSLLSVLAPAGAVSVGEADTLFFPDSASLVLPKDSVHIDTASIATPSVVSQVLEADGTITLVLPGDLLPKAAIRLLIRTPAGMIVHRESFESWGDFHKRATPVNVEVPPPAEVPMGQQATVENVLRGRVISIAGRQCDIKAGMSVALWGFDELGGTWLPVLFATVDRDGYFQGPYPIGEFKKAVGVVPLLHPNPIPVREEDSPGCPIRLEGGRFPAVAILGVDATELRPKGPSDVATHLEGADSVPRAPDQETRIQRSADFTADPGSGECLSFTAPNRTIEEFDFFTVVRTSEPEIRGITVEDIQETAVSPPPSDPKPLLPQGILGMALKVEKDVSFLASAGLNLAAAGILAATDTPSSLYSNLTPAASPTSSGASSSDETVIARHLEEAARLHSLKKELDGIALAKRRRSGTLLGPAAALGKGSAGVRLHREDLSSEHPVDWDDTPTMYQATSVAHGHVLHFKQVWRADGYSLGDLLYSLPLAPCQTKQIVTVDWERRETASRVEGITEAEQLAATLSRDRDVSEIVNSLLTERVRGASTASSSSFSAGLGLGFVGNGVSTMLGVAGGKSKAKTSAWQNSSRSLGASTAQELSDRTQQAASQVRSKRSTVITEARQGETIGVETTSVTNHNHCHAMTMEYFEVLRHFLVSEELSSVQECLFVPLLMSPFDRGKALRWRDILERFVPQHLRKGFSALERIEDEYRNSDFPAGSFAEDPLIHVDGEIRISLVVGRPPDPPPDIALNDLADSDLDSGWGLFGIVFGLGAADIYRRYRRQQEQRDQFFDLVMAPAYARRYVEGLKVTLMGENGGTWDAGFDVTLVKDYRRPSFPYPHYRGRQESSLYVKFNPGDPIRGKTIPRRVINQVVIVANQDQAHVLPTGSRAIVEMAQFRYRTDHYQGVLYSSRRVLNDLVDDDVVLPVFLSKEERRNPRNEDAELARHLIRHLNDNLEPYHRAIWLNMDQERRYMMLDGFLAPGKEGRENGRSLASVLENRLMGIVGNTLVFPVAPGFILDPMLVGATKKDDDGKEATVDERDGAQELMDLYRPLTPYPRSVVSIPTKGVFAEGVLGSCNTCEEIDDTRFWRWSQEPCTDTPTAILPVDTSTRRATPEDTTPSQIGTQLNIQAPEAAPVPTSAGSVIDTVARQLFPEAMGIEGTQAANREAFKSTMAAAVTLAESAGRTAAESRAQRTAPSETSQAIRQIRQEADAGNIDSETAKRLTERALRSSVGAIDANSPEGVKSKIDAIAQAEKAGIITSDQKKELGGAALRRMIEDGGAGLAKQPELSTLLKDTKGDVEVRDGDQYLKITNPEVGGLLSDTGEPGKSREADAEVEVITNTAEDLATRPKLIIKRLGQTFEQQARDDHGGHEVGAYTYLNHDGKHYYYKTDGENASDKRLVKGYRAKIVVEQLDGTTKEWDGVERANGFKHLRAGSQTTVTMQTRHTYEDTCRKELYLGDNCFIHIANYPCQVAGCVGPGTGVWDGFGVSESEKALGQINDALGGWKKGKQFRLEILGQFTTPG